MKVNVNNFILIIGFLIMSVTSFSQPIIADHRVVNRYSAIPDKYIAEVKKMLLNIAGESHARGYRYGLELLAAQDSGYDVSLKRKGAPEAPSINNLRVSGVMLRSGNKWDIAVGEEDAWTSSWAVDNFINTIAYMDRANNPKSAMGIGWCYDMYTYKDLGSKDPVHGCRWHGHCSVYNGTGAGNITFAEWGEWGLDNEDSLSLGGSRITMDMYLRAIEKANASTSKTTVFYTTGPVDYKAARFYENGREDLYQVDVKHEYIREYVRKSNNAYLFDYADILCWDEAGKERTETWNGHTYQKMQLDYIGDYDGGIGHGCHINEAACLRLGKAMWWMLAHMAGWQDETITVVNKQ